MGEMIINYSKLNGLSNTAKKAADRYNKRINQLEGFRKKLDELDTLNTGNLNQANLQIKNRINECINKKEKMTIFKQKIDELENEALNTDRKVAKRIKQDSKYFKVKNNIKTGIGTHILVYLNQSKYNPINKLEFITKLITGCTTEQFREAININFRNLKYNIKDFYYEKGGKYWINILKDGVTTVAAATLLIAAAVGSGAWIIAAPGGIAATIWLGYKGITKYIYDVKALKEFNTTKNNAKADKIDDKDHINASEYIGGKVTSATIGNREIGEKIGRGTTQVISSYFLFKNLKDFTKNKISEIKAYDKNISFYKNLISTKPFNKDDLTKLDKSTNLIKRFSQGIGIDDINTLNKISNMSRDIGTITMKVNPIGEVISSIKSYKDDYFSAKKSKNHIINNLNIPLHNIPNIRYINLNPQANTSLNRYKLYNFGT